MHPAVANPPARQPAMRMMPAPSPRVLATSCSGGFSALDTSLRPSETPPRPRPHGHRGALRGRPADVPHLGEGRENLVSAEDGLRRS